MIKIKSLFICFLFLLICVDSYAQDNVKPNSSSVEKKAEKKKQEKIRKSNKAREVGIKHHQNIQSKEVRKKMRRNARRYQHVASYDRKPNLFRRIFPRKNPKGVY